EGKSAQAVPSRSGAIVDVVGQIPELLQDRVVARDLLGHEVRDLLEQAPERLELRALAGHLEDALEIAARPFEAGHGPAIAEGPFDPHPNVVDDGFEFARALDGHGNGGDCTR